MGPTVTRIRKRRGYSIREFVGDEGRNQMVSNLFNSKYVNSLFFESLNAFIPHSLNTLLKRIQVNLM